MKWTEDDEKQPGQFEKEAVYPFEIVNAEEKVSQKGNPYLNLQLKVFVGEHERTLYDVLMPQMPAKLRAFCEVMGLMDQYNDRTLSVTDCNVGQGYIRMTKKEDQNGYLKVDTYLAFDPAKGKPESEKKPPVTVPDGDSGADDEVPF